MSRSDRTGFTLVEALVAIAILGLGFTAVLRVFSDHSRRAVAIDARLVAQLKAESLLARALAGDIVPQSGVSVTPADRNGLRHIEVEVDGFRLESLGWMDIPEGAR